MTTSPEREYMDARDALRAARIARINADKVVKLEEARVAQAEAAVKAADRADRSPDRIVGVPDLAEAPPRSADFLQVIALPPLGRHTFHRYPVTTTTGLGRKCLDCDHIRDWPDSPKETA
jgi:hypothetical protein